jgi:phosphoadenosine phosphosulfate reductase
VRRVIDGDALERMTPRARLAWALAEFGDALLFTSSFGAGSGVLLHLWSELARERPVVFLDTGFLFPETLAYKDELAQRLGLRVEIVRPIVDANAFVRAHGDDIQRRDADFCCKHNKIDPLAPYERAAKAWVSGLRRDQGRTREELPIARTQSNGPTKIHPIATMTRDDVRAYMREHEIPEHPLVVRRYLSIGCAPCTAPVDDGADERAGRWSFSEKTECGLHGRFG